MRGYQIVTEIKWRSIKIYN